mmetsp:Transcript_3958/g.5560  ORF Transcript_3958/g.5560 Transcript_3958/m.5560 type:complete len:189 (-) Transcript_3958:842-1408(-)
MGVEKRKKGEAGSARFYPAYDIKPKAKSAEKKPTKLRESLSPGTILILLAGRFRGKRVVMLKALDSGLLLISGPYSVNGVPLRRVNPAYVIATSTKIDISSVKLPESLNDDYFKREAPAKKTKKNEQGEFFTADEEPEEIGPSETRKADQVQVDDQLVPIIDQTPMLKSYLGALFTLTKGMKPHEMKF